MEETEYIDVIVDRNWFPEDSFHIIKDLLKSLGNKRDIEYDISNKDTEYFSVDHK